MRFTTSLALLGSLVAARHERELNSQFYKWEDVYGCRFRNLQPNHLPSDATEDYETFIANNRNAESWFMIAQAKTTTTDPDHMHFFFMGEDLQADTSDWKVHLIEYQDSDGPLEMNRSDPEALCFYKTSTAYVYSTDKNYSRIDDVMTFETGSDGKSVGACPGAGNRVYLRDDSNHSFDVNSAPWRHRRMYAEITSDAGGVQACCALSDLGYYADDLFNMHFHTYDENDMTWPWERDCP